MLIYQINLDEASERGDTHSIPLLSKSYEVVRWSAIFGHPLFMQGSDSASNPPRGLWWISLCTILIQEMSPYQEITALSLISKTKT